MEESVYEFYLAGFVAARLKITDMNFGAKDARRILAIALGVCDAQTPDARPYPLTPTEFDSLLQRRLRN